jgi:HK97 family phage major capsid protein
MASTLPVEDLISVALKQDNANDPTAMILAPRTWRTIEGFVDLQGQPLRAPHSIERIPRLVSTPIAQTQGTANNAFTIVLGDFTQMMLGVRSELRIELLREKYADTLQYGFIAHLRFDVQLAHAQSFAKLIGITP